MNHFKISTTVVFSIIATGVILNLASSGTFGQTAQSAANFVIKGYGSA